MYSIIALHNGQDVWLAQVRAAVSRATRALQLGADLVDWPATTTEAPDSQAIVIYLASDNGPSRYVDKQIRDFLSMGLRVIPVATAGTDVFGTMPTELRVINAVFWERDGSDAARSLLDALGIIEHERKVFISYRRGEGDWIANQMWERLGKARFDVFLDRFSIPPGEDFQKKVDSELSDKAFVVIIESPKAAKSPWVSHEVTYAHAHYIGVLALTLPGVHELDRFLVIDDAFRIQLAPEQLRGRRRCTLRNKAVGEVVGRIQLEHAKVLRRHRAELLGSAREFATRAGWDTSEIADSTLLLHQGTGRESLLHVTPRLPRPIDLWSLSQLRDRLENSGHLSSGASANLVYYAGKLDGETASVLNWIGEGRNLDTTDLSSLPAVL